MYNVFTIRKNIYQLRITLKKIKIFNGHKSFFLNYVVPHGTVGREWVKYHLNTLKYKLYIMAIIIKYFDHHQMFSKLVHFLYTYLFFIRHIKTKRAKIMKVLLF